MASTGINSGKVVALYNAGVKVSHGINVSLNIDQGLRDLTTKDSSKWVDNGPGLLSFSMDAEFYFAEDAAESFSDAFGDMTGQTAVQFMVSSDVTGDMEYYGDGFISNLSLQGGLASDNQGWNMSVTGTGALNERADSA